MSETIELDPHYIIELGPEYYEDEEWRYVADYVYDRWRWGTIERYILQRKSDGKYFAADLRFQPEHGVEEYPVNLVEVERKEVVTVVWKEVKRESQDRS